LREPETTSGRDARAGQAKAGSRFSYRRPAKQPVFKQPVFKQPVFKQPVFKQPVFKRTSFIILIAFEYGDSLLSPWYLRRLQTLFPAVIG